MYDWPKLRENVLAVVVSGSLVSYLGYHTFDWWGWAVAEIGVFAALLWAYHDARVDDEVES